MRLHELMGKEVKLFPTDTYDKFGVLEDCNGFGMLFRITRAHEKSTLRVGQTYYVSHSTPLVLEIVEEEQ